MDIYIYISPRIFLSPLCSIPLQLFSWHLTLSCLKSISNYTHLALNLWSLCPNLMIALRMEASLIFPHFLYRINQHVSSALSPECFLKPLIPLQQHRQLSRIISVISYPDKSNGFLNDLLLSSFDTLCSPPSEVFTLIYKSDEVTSWPEFRAFLAI